MYSTVSLNIWTLILIDSLAHEFNDTISRVINMETVLSFFVLDSRAHLYPRLSFFTVKPKSMLTPYFKVNLSGWKGHIRILFDVVEVSLNLKWFVIPVHF